MKKINYFILLFVIVVPFQIKAQDRNVYWLHGLEGNKYTMRVYSEIYPQERKIAPYNIPSYSTRRGVDTAAQELFSNWKNGGSNTIVVAQSMGGLVSLQMFKDSGTVAFGGLITTGTAYRGVPTAKNIDEPVFVNLLNDMVNKGVPSKLALILFAPSFWSSVRTEINLVFGTNFSIIEDGLSGTITNIQKTLSDFFFGSDETKAELRPDSPIISDLQNVDLQNIPRVAIWGHEDNPTVLRLAGSVFEKKLYNGSLGLGELGDQKVTNMVGTIADKMEEARQKCITRGYIAAATIVGGALAAAYFYAASQFENPEHFWRYGLEPGLDQVIGAFRTETTTQTYQDWVCDGSSYLKSTNKTPNCHWETKTRTVYVTIPTPNDGIIPDLSAKAMPGVQSQCILEAKSTNHMQLTNSNEVKAKLDDIFGGNVQDSRKPKFFIIPRR